MMMKNESEPISIVSLSHPGVVRQDNQDCCGFRIPGEDLRSRGILLTVADGMGGHAGGATAARLAVDVLMSEYYESRTDDVSESLKSCFRRANEEIVDRGRQDEELRGMATTLTAVVVKEDRFYYAHVGDSRGYYISDGRMTQFTTDHSYVADLIKAGVITEDEAETHPKRNVITRAVGAGSELKIDVSKKYQKIRKDEHILLCSDGLYKVLNDEQILLVFKEYHLPEQLCHELVRRAIAGGGPDNITVMVARMNKSAGTAAFIRSLMKKLG
jgi:PPM family protein phosphatase